MVKKYYSVNKSRFTIVAKDGDKIVVVQFTGSKMEYKTDNANVQNSIEGTQYFKQGKIAFENIGEQEKEADEEEPKKIKSYDNVATIQEAIEVLRYEYGVTQNKLRTPEAVKLQAIANNVEFPNLA